jgi:hypothetical protein
MVKFLSEHHLKKSKTGITPALAIKKAGDAGFETVLNFRAPHLSRCVTGGAVDFSFDFGFDFPSASWHTN